MQHDRNDPKGYYSILGLASSASEQEIKAAYRRRAMDLHPDRNHESDTTEQFQYLNEAYAVLSDANSRAEYDESVFQQQDPEPSPPEVPEPIVCSVCGKISAQPRIVVFRSVKSFLIVTIRKPIAGVYCSNCAQNQSLKASATTWLLGWWGFPWGPVYTLQALVTNMFGGSLPPLDNARMLGYQAYYFYASGRADLALSLAETALGYCRKVSKTTNRNSHSENERDGLVTRLEGFLGALGGEKTNRLKSNWGIFQGRFFLHFGMIAIAAGAIYSAISSYSPTHYSVPRGPMPYSAQPLSSLPAPGLNATTSQSAANAVVNKEVPKKPAYVRPKTAPNGRPWPKSANYLVGEPQMHKSGHSEVTIDNVQNNADVLLKLVALDGKVARPARQIFVPVHSSFTIKTLSAGNYDVRYRDLTSGGLSRSESIKLTETTTSRGTEYSVVTLTLYKVANGNTATYGLSEDEF